MIEWIRSADSLALMSLALAALAAVYMLARLLVKRRRGRHDPGSIVRRLRREGANASLCPHCRGAGRRRQHRICPHCHGLGYLHDMSDDEIFKR